MDEKVTTFQQMNEEKFNSIIEKTRDDLYNLMNCGCDDILKKKIVKILVSIDSKNENKDDEPQWLKDAAHDVGLGMKKKRRTPKVYD